MANDKSKLNYDQRDTGRQGIPIGHSLWDVQPMLIGYPPCVSTSLDPENRWWMEIHKAQVPEDLYSIEYLGG